MGCIAHFALSLCPLLLLRVFFSGYHRSVSVSLFLPRLLQSLPFLYIHCIYPSTLDSLPRLSRSNTRKTAQSTKHSESAPLGQLPSSRCQQAEHLARLPLAPGDVGAACHTPHSHPRFPSLNVGSASVLALPEGREADAFLRTCSAWAIDGHSIRCFQMLPGNIRQPVTPRFCWKDSGESEMLGAWSCETPASWGVPLRLWRPCAGKGSGKRLKKCTKMYKTQIAPKAPKTVPRTVSWPLRSALCWMHVLAHLEHLMLKPTHSTYEDSDVLHQQSPSKQRPYQPPSWT